MTDVSQLTIDGQPVDAARLADVCRRYGVAELSVFGSVARGEAGPDSDVDLLVAFDGPATFDRHMDLKLFLEELLGRRVDRVTELGLPSIMPAVTGSKNASRDTSRC